MKGFKTTEEESNLDECNNYLNSDNNSEFRIHITERNKNILEETHKDNNKAENLSHIKDNAKNTIKERKYSKSQSENKSNSEHVIDNKTQTNPSKDVVKTIFAWIGIIVVVLIVGTIIISILDEILPYNWWNKYRNAIYPAGLALGRWLQKEFNW